MNKSFAILDIYNLLIKREQFNVDTISIKYSVSRRTTMRYVRQVRKFVNEYYPGYDVVFDKINQTYRLVQVTDWYMNIKKIALI